MTAIFAAAAGLAVGLTIAVGVVVLVLIDRPRPQVVVYRGPAPVRVGEYIDATSREK